jgi:hypothetical protein
MRVDPIAFADRVRELMAARDWQHASTLAKAADVDAQTIRRMLGTRKTPPKNVAPETRRAVARALDTTVGEMLGIPEPEFVDELPAKLDAILAALERIEAAVSPQSQGKRKAADAANAAAQKQPKRPRARDGGSGDPRA